MTAHRRRALVRLGRITATSTPTVGGAKPSPEGGRSADGSRQAGMLRLAPEWARYAIARMRAPE